MILENCCPRNGTGSVGVVGRKEDEVWAKSRGKCGFKIQTAIHYRTLGQETSSLGRGLKNAGKKHTKGAEMNADNNKLLLALVYLYGHFSNCMATLTVNAKVHTFTELKGPEGLLTSFQESNLYSFQMLLNEPTQTRTEGSSERQCSS